MKTTQNNTRHLKKQTAPNLVEYLQFLAFITIVNLL